MTEQKTPIQDAMMGLHERIGKLLEERGRELNCGGITCYTADDLKRLTECLAALAAHVSELR